MLGIGTALAGFGINFVKDLIMDNGEDLVKEGIKGLTGIDLNKKKVTELNSEEIQAIKNAEVELSNLDFKRLRATLEDREGARKHNIDIQSSKDWLVRNTGSLIAIFTIFTAFVLDVILIYMVVNGTTVNPIYTLIQGAMNVRAVQVLSFYFGDNKTNADLKRA